ncbi:MAG: carboxylating nicotinate-nucleotide diphosphorylase [Candidatus Kryptoniota bacterium]
MTFRDVLKERIHHDIGFDFFLKDGAPRLQFNIIFKENAVVCGTVFIPTIVKVVNDEFFLESAEDESKPQIKLIKKDGENVSVGEIVAELYGNAEVLLKAERTICNFLSELSGIATHVRRNQKILEDKFSLKSVFLLDTRKDDPLMRAEHKYAVRIGGARNHRFGFFDGILIKDNDIAVYGGISRAIDRRLSEARFLTRVEIEVGNLDNLKEVLIDGRVDAILLDNMSTDMLGKAVDMISKSGKSYLIEASGVREEDISEVSKTGVNFISLSALVRKAPFIDVSMKAVDPL